MSMKRLLTSMISLLLLCATGAVQAGGYYGYGYRGHYHGHGDGAALAAGLIVGGLVGWALSENRYRSREYVYRDYYYAPPVEHHHTHTVYRPVYTTTVTQYPAVARYPAQYRYPVQYLGSEFAGHNCRMTREYTTTIEIDGQPQTAYGTRCLTEDGSWVLGQPRLAPKFD